MKRKSFRKIVLSNCLFSIAIGFYVWHLALGGHSFKTLLLEVRPTLKVVYTFMFLSVLLANAILFFVNWKKATLFVHKLSDVYCYVLEQRENEISVERPLMINIKSTEENRIIARNNHQHKETSEKSLGMGLENLEKQISFFSDEKLLVRKVAGSFMVTIPTFSK